MKKMANIKIESARVAAGKEAMASENFRFVAISECVWSLLDFPYVITSYKPIHICTLLLENHYQTVHA